MGADPTSCHENVVLNFLAELRRDKALSYQTICGYRSAIGRQHTSLGETALSRLPAIRRLIRACFVEKPPLPRYGDIWEVDTVLKYLESLHPAASLSDFDLSVKTVTLAFILSLSRFCYLIYSWDK